MDVRAKAWMRACYLGATAAGLMGPQALDAQTYRPSTTPLGRQSLTATKATPSTAPRPAQGAISLATYESTGQGGVQVAQSEVEQRLRELYERDGREMPPMNLTPAQPTPGQQTPGQAPAPQGQAGAPRNVSASQPRYSSAPPLQPTQKPSPNKVTSFFKKLVPGGNKKQAQTPPVPPRQLPPPQQPIVQSAPPMYAPPPTQTVPPELPAPVQVPPPSPQLQQQPQRFVAQPTAQPPAIVQQPAAATQPRVALPPNPATTANAAVSFGNPVGGVEPALTAAGTDEDSEFFLPPTPQAGAAPARSLAQPELSIEEEDDLDGDDLLAAPQMVEPPAAQQVDDFDPFGERASTPTESTDAAEEENPFTGQTLEPADSAPPAVIREEPVDESTATKMRRIIQRTDMKGLKGFCPVTLRDQRELADSRPDFVGSYRGQKFFFASKVAQAKFEQDPARYAPAAYGADVVVLTDDQDVAEGSLDYAAWYKGRLYLFGTQETHDKFVENPEQYASPPGIE